MEGVWALQSPSGYADWLEGTCSSQLRPGHTPEAHPVHSPHIRQMPAEALVPGNYSACFNTTSCCQGKVMALTLSFIE